MKVTKQGSTLISLVVGCAFALATAAAAAADGKVREGVFENAYVKVERITLAPGEELPTHAGKWRIVYSLSDYTIAWTEDGKTKRKSWRQGDVHAHEALDHGMKNVGNTIAEVLIVARKDTVLPAAEVGAGASQVAGGFAAELADFDGMRVLRVALPPGAAQPMHDGKARLSYALNDHRMRFTTEDGGLQEVTHLAGDAHWHDAGRHAVENVGNTAARYVLFAFD